MCASMAPDVFICHASKDKRVTDSICSEFEASGLKCWVAPRDISVGEDWAEAVRNAIESASLFALIFSENANAARHVEREIANAFYTRRTIVVYRLTAALPRRELILYLANCHWIDSDVESGALNAKALLAGTQALLPGSRPAAGRDISSTSLVPRTATLSQVYARDGTAINVPVRIPRIVKGIALAGSMIFAVGMIWWLGAEQTDSNRLPDNNSSAYTYHPPTKSPTDAKQDAPEVVPNFEFSRFGLWVPRAESSKPAVPAGPISTPSPSPEILTANSAPVQSSDANQNAEDEDATLAAQQNADAGAGKTAHRASRRERHQGRSRSKVRKAKPPEESGLASVTRRVKVFFRDGVERIRQAWNR
jgi:hypothetical protein